MYSVGLLTDYVVYTFLFCAPNTVESILLHQYPLLFFPVLCFLLLSSAVLFSCATHAQMGKLRPQHTLYNDVWCRQQSAYFDKWYSDLTE
jgi:hypothetical protein